MRKPLVLRALAAVLVSVLLLSVGSALAGSLLRPQAEDPLEDLGSLLSYSGQAKIEDLVGETRDEVIENLMTMPETKQLRWALLEKGFVVSLSEAEAMSVAVGARTIEVMVAPAPAALQVFLPLVLRGYGGSDASPAWSSTSVNAPVGGQITPSSRASPEGSVAYLTAMVADDGTSLFQAHVTNLDPQLAEIPDPQIIVNAMPYFYVTTLRWVGGRIVPWRYWWYDSHHHPNWYYACYRHYWDAYHGAGYAWPGWHDWAYGWIYWRFWYFWSAWFPWAVLSVP